MELYLDGFFFPQKLPTTCKNVLCQYFFSLLFFHFILVVNREHVLSAF